MISIRVGQKVVLYRGCVSGPWTVDRIRGRDITLVWPGQPGIIIADKDELRPFA